LVGSQVQIAKKQLVVEKLIGEGGFGFVYEVADLSQRSSKYALKQIYL